MARLSELQKKEITTAISLTKADWMLIKQHQGAWDSKNLKDITARIRKHYKFEQNKLCAYCKLPFRDDVHGEHIVPKDGKYGRKEFSFYPRNLVAACKHCNTSKSTNNDMIPWTRIPYPASGLNFKIIHPHFDRYFDHIQIVDKSRYVRKTIKGHNTIQRCKLYDPTILEVLVEYMRYQDDPIVNGVLRLRELQGNFTEIIDRFINKFFT